MSTAKESKGEESKVDSFHLRQLKDRLVSAEKQLANLENSSARDPEALRLQLKNRIADTKKLIAKASK